MIIKEREPAVVYTTGSSDWSAANAIIALVVVAVLGVVVYYFSIVNSNRFDSSASIPQPPTIIQMPAQAPAAPSTVTVNSPPAAPSSVTVKEPASPPADVTAPAAPSTPDNTSSQ